MANFVFKKEENLVYETDFEEIEILTEISVNKHKSIARKSMIKTVVNGETEEIFSKEDYQLNMVSSCCKFDGKSLTPAEISRFEKEFFIKLFLLLIPNGEEELQEQKSLGE
jgi:hypothetical protein